MFASCGEHLFFYQLSSANLTDDMIKIDENHQQMIATIKKTDFDSLALPLPNNVNFTPLRQMLAHVNVEMANLMSKAVQVLRWRDDHHFCSRCGSRTFLHPIEFSANCPTCHYQQYPRIQPCIITAILKNIDNRPHILLAHHQRAKDNKMYGLIAGFVEIGESLEQCVHREVAEEVGLTISNLRYLGSQPWAFPSNLMVGFVADYMGGEINIDKQELIHADFFPIDELGQPHSPITPPKGTIAHYLIEQVKQQNLC